MQPQIFISHSNSATATALERVIRASFPGEVEVFNTGRAATGLAAGQPVDGGILDRLRSASCFIWMATPASVLTSFWMAWELGAASSREDLPIVPVRCLGINADQLPLLQGGRNAPDLGVDGDLKAFLSTIKNLIGLEDDCIGEATSKWQDSRSPFWGTADNEGLTVRILGTRMLFENRTADQIVILASEIIEPERAGMDCLRVGATFGPGERRIFEAPEIVELKPASTAYIEWQAERGGRHFARIQLGGM